MYGNICQQAYCGDHFTIYANIKSLFWTPETDMLCINNISIRSIIIPIRQIQVERDLISQGNK